VSVIDNAPTPSSCHKTILNLHMSCLCQTKKTSEMKLFLWLATNYTKNACGQHIERENYGRTDISSLCCFARYTAITITS